jgi:GT2 family glycosyltransferase
MTGKPWEIAPPRVQATAPRREGVRTARSRSRPAVRGKFVVWGNEKLYVRGVTYGTFRPGPDGSDFPPVEVVERDFSAMTACGVNAVRTYSLPPRWLLELALEHGLLVMVGLPWEEHVAFLSERARRRSIERRVREGVRACAGHPAVLCYAIGNEIPASIVRWHGRRRVSRFLERLYEVTKDEDPDGLATYVNYPSTEYLQPDFVDLVCVNLYLESEERFERYLARLHTIAGEKPLLVAELGLDSRRHGEARQAELLERQVRAAFASGCVGAFVFAWTDEWHRGGFDVADWDFGLTTRERRPKRALAAVRRAFSDMPLPADTRWPRISVVVCTHNGAKTLRDCCEGLLALEYPDAEVIIVDDGSTDESAVIAGEFGFRLVRTQNRGLASARNVGLAEATGEYVAYIDDDARPDPHWLHYLATTFACGYAAVGGPNLAPAGDGALAHCVANAPGGPTHVLLTDTEAEHLPGCNMAFRTDALRALGGFDPRFRIAGDDVDVCWRLLRDEKLGFSPAAVVWHHRRNSIRAYWRQQREYGRAEALLERKWPAKYNLGGHVSWGGRVYGRGLTPRLGIRRRIRYGTWGSAEFQTTDPAEPGMLASLPGTPEWYLVLGGLAVLSALGAAWQPLMLTLPLLCVATLALVAQAVHGARAAAFPARYSRLRKAGLRALVAALHLLQPLARLRGRLGEGLSPWRRRGPRGLALPAPRRRTVWTQAWQPPTQRLRTIGRALLAEEAAVLRGGEFDRWELEVRTGALGGARLRMAVEEHGAGRQLARFRIWPRWSRLTLLLLAVLAPLVLLSGLDGAYVAASVLGALGAATLGGAVLETGRAVCALLRALERLARGEEVPPVDLAPIEGRDAGGSPTGNGARRQLLDADALEALVARSTRTGRPRVRR